MNSSVGSEIVTGFIEEVEGYLPDMSRCLQTLQQNRAHRPSLAELHRITHTIKGAAAMVGLNDLSGIGEVLEKVMENVLGASLTLDDETITLLDDATQRIDSYCMMQRAGGPDDGQLFQKTVAKIEEKLCRSTVESDEVEGSLAESNPETILLEQGAEEDIALDLDLDLDLTDDSIGDLFAEVDIKSSEDADTESIFDEIFSSVSQVEEETEEDDDLFGSVVTEQPDSSEESIENIENVENVESLTSARIEIDPELLECFREETEEHLENIDSCLNSLSVQITDSVALTPPTQEILHSLRRSVHTLKGAAAVIGIEPIAAWGHDFEDFLDWLHDEARKLDPATVAALRDGADLLASFAEEPTRPAEQEKQRITAKFADITETFSSGSTVSEGYKDDKGEETDSSLVFDEAEDTLGLLDLSRDSAVGFFTEDDTDESEQDDAGSFFDEISSSVSLVEEEVEGEFFLQDTDEEDDFFGSVIAGLSASPEDSEDSFVDVAPFVAAGIPEKEQSKAVAEAIDPELMQCFREETDEHLENIDDCLNRLAVQVTAPVELTATTRETLHSLRRSVHTLKGAAAVIGIEPVAAWGHDFEDFLDWLHDEAGKLDSPIIVLLRQGADLLAEISEDPACPVEQRKNDLTGQFKEIIAGSARAEDTSFIEEHEESVDHAFFPEEEGTLQEELQVAEETAQEHGEGADNFFDELSVDTPYAAETAFESLPEMSEFVEADGDFTSFTDQVSEVKAKAGTVRQSQIKKTATLRVDINRIDQMVGLSGDMVINLSSFEDSMDAASKTMKEFDMILQRLKNINSSLEAGYELASIPHLGNQDNSQLSGINEDFDPLEMDRYSELNILIRSLSEAVSDLDSIMTQNALDNVAKEKTVERQGMVLKELQNRMMGVRMTPFSTLSSRMHRTVREAERTTGHPARLTIDGESIMMDTRVWDVMADPLMHILRNAVAHGGSLPQKAGQEPISITIQAIRRGGQCTLRVSDNGKGLDYEAIRVKGMKLYPNDRVNLMSNSELAELIFRHGFSSTGSITNIAGRGVGMDVVRDAIDQLNGSTDLISERGQGTEFIMRLPVAVAQLPAILARFGTQIYALPMHDLASVVRATPDEKKGREYTFDGETIPLLHPAKVPGFETNRGYVKKNLTEDDQALLIVHAGRKRAAVLCEQLIGQRDIVFKDLGTHLHNVPCISGVTIMGNGTLIPILQVEEILQKWTSVMKRRDEEFAVRPVNERGPLRILVVDDSISVRKVVSNFIIQQGWIPIAARNGIEAIEEIRREKPDVILLDVEMPRMNGFEVLQALQAQPELRDIPVAMLTSRSAGKYQDKAKDLGARGFMTKPFKEDEVIRFIRKETSGE